MESFPQSQWYADGIFEKFPHEKQGLSLPGRLYAYDTGYGDFCFYPRTGLVEVSKNHCSPKKNYEPVELSACDKFRLMDLPREIRNEIYKIVVSPMIKSSRREKPFPEFDGVSLAVYLTRYVKPRSLDLSLTHISKSGSECTPQICQQAHVSRRKTFVGRHFSYEILPAGVASLEDLYTIRNLSHANSIIRKELAEVVWARTSISFDNNSINAFEALLIERPAIWTGIKNLRLELSFFKFPADEFEFPIPKSFVHTCDLVSTILQLESLELIITMEEDDVKKFFKSKAKPSWVKGVRKLPVRGRFDLVLFTLPPDTDDDEEKQHAELQQKYEQRMKEELCPDSLKPKAWDDLTDEERYMRTRL